MPVRIQRLRAKGWRMPRGAICVARPSKWGNRFRIGAPDPETGAPMTAEIAVERFRAWVDPYRDLIRADLGGRDLACWCPLPKPGEPDVCHADVLLKIANP